MNRKILKKLVSFLATAVFTIAVPYGAEAQVKGVFYGADFGDSLASVKTRLSDQCRSLRVFTVEEPNFPLAKDSEKHLVCEGIRIGMDEIREVAFAFGDDRLSLIEARSGAVKALTARASAEAKPYLHFKAYFEDLMLADTKADAVWLLSPESIHPNLFAWSNPYLPSNKGDKTVYRASAKNPELLKFGSTLAELLPGFEGQCPIFNVEKIAEPWLQTKPKTQTQINCFGYEYGGFPRKIEAVFGDDVLELAWILTGKGEEDRLRKALTAEYGEPTFVNEDWEAFEGWRIALRKDKPEVLVLSERLAPIFKGLIEDKDR
ncbi:MAG: hypothetical protein IPM63_13630 [Acidobacteriota bacterium]|nr:MAG: hypothetical protein IPM63_13630 [Acidobacteriota bacterium]